MPQAAPRFESHVSLPDILPQIRSQNDAMLASPRRGSGYGQTEMEQDSSCFAVMYDGSVKFLPDGSNRHHEKKRWQLRRCLFRRHFVEEHSHCWVNLGFRSSSCRR